MPESLLFFSTLAIGLLAGLLLGRVTWKKWPNRCKSYLKFCLDGKWWIYAVGIVMFLGLSIMSFEDGRLYFGTFYFLLSCLQAFALITCGFKRLTPEQEARIDAADPTTVRPIQFWKQTKP